MNKELFTNYFIADLYFTIFEFGCKTGYEHRAMGIERNSYHQSIFWHKEKSIYFTDVNVYVPSDTFFLIDFVSEKIKVMYD